MPWTKTLAQVGGNGTNTTVVVVFSDGQKYKVAETFNVAGMEGAADFRARVENRRQALETLYTFFDGLDATFDLTIQAPAQPTKEQQALADFLVLWAKLQSWKRAAVDGMPDADAQVTALREQLAGLWLPAYISSI